jgi:hypothetical protein
MSPAPPTDRTGRPARYAADLAPPAAPFLPGGGRPRPAPFVPPPGVPGWPVVPLHRDPAFREGVDLYHLGYWWEAHERWEATWRRAPRPDPVHALLRGAILLAASHLKRVQGRPDGAARLLERSLTHLERAARAELVEKQPPADGAALSGTGLDVAGLLAAVRAWSARQPALAWPTDPAGRRAALLEGMPRLWLPE